MTHAVAVCKRVKRSYLPITGRKKMHSFPRRSDWTKNEIAHSLSLTHTRTRRALHVCSRKSITSHVLWRSDTQTARRFRTHDWKTTELPCFCLHQVEKNSFFGRQTHQDRCFLLNGPQWLSEKTDCLLVSFLLSLFHALYLHPRPTALSFESRSNLK